jgi:pimeloyl-ACP methyl ester carboxylesterase
MSRFSTAIGAWLVLIACIAASQEKPPSDTFTDPSPHRSGFAIVNGIELHYLDWGGNGQPLVFLHGLGNSAHIFDDLAPEFVDRYRVLALTWRGHGKSDKPKTGYDVDTLTEDLRQFLDTMKIQKVILAGHSMAGEELTRFAGLYPERLLALVYLDAAFDRTIPEFTSFFEESRRKAPDVYALLNPTPADRASIEAMRAFSRKTRGGWSNAIEADWRATSSVFHTPDEPALDPGQLVRMIAQGYRSPEYSKVKAPTLSFFTMLTMESAFPWITADTDASVRKQAKDLLELDMIPRQRPQIAKFRADVPHARVIEMPNTRHDCFIQRQEDVVREMRAFLAGR